MRLALSLGRTLSELFRSMSAAEYRLWQARELIDPLPDPWLQTGQVCASVLAPHSRRVPNPGDFIPRSDLRSRRQTPEQIRDAFTLIGASIKGP